MASDNKLSAIKDETIILSLLNSAKEANAEVFVWKLVGANKHMVKVKIESVRKGRGDFCLIPIQERDPEVKSLIVGQPHIDIYIPESALLMRCEIRQSDAPVRYYIKIPNFVAQVERRKSFRLDCYDDGDILVSFNKPTALLRNTQQFFKKACFDISSGGFSFLISKAESKFFDVEDKIVVADIAIGPWSAKTSAQVTMLKEMNPDEYNGLTYKVWRVCCKFTFIDDVSKKYLDKYIFERIKDELRVITK